MQAIVDAAWMCSRDKVFKKKRNSILVKSKTSKTGEDLNSTMLKALSLEEIDENEESSRIIVEEVDNTPLKTARVPSLNFIGSSAMR